ncbi:FliH/SctL family protein [Amphibiibacter pelophylacis]|uniref:FliH/SctL family protein n=1 Tax=Amphibiibacter pelophylacis TaxID=1799477 RepID=A0ACC6NZH8_9BURK
MSFTPADLPSAAAAPTSAAPDRRVQTRFIPREELSGFAAWRPGEISDPSGSASGGLHTGYPASGPEPAPPPPTDAELEASQAKARQVASMLQQARESGYQDGHRDGLVALDAFKQTFARQTSTQVARWLEAFDARMQDIEREMSATLAELAVQLARQVVRCELRTQPELIAEVASDAVNALVLTSRHISVRLHPDDMAWVEAGASEILSARDVRLIADSRVSPGGCLIESDTNAMDMSIEQRWHRAAASLGMDTPWHTEREPEDTPSRHGH